jgi:hypothetical protein
MLCGMKTWRRLSKRWKISLVVLAVVVIVAIASGGSKSKSTSTNSSTTASTPTHTTTSVTIKPTTAAIPAACHEAIEEAEHIGSIAGQGFKEGSEYIPLIVKAAKAGSEQSASDIEAVTHEEDEINSKVKETSAELTPAVASFNKAKEGCK